jgi:bifunctional UDP-N-acetylglucosamine pyrophosphorylase/glucosamine-1-phosphate N-acetyltransferase
MVKKEKKNRLYPPMVAVIILAAGQSRRMKSSLSKVFHKLGGKPLVHYVRDATGGINPRQIIAVVAPKDATNPALVGMDIAIQETALGTAHAVRMALPLLHDDIERILVLCGDVPTLPPELIEHMHVIKADVGVVAMRLEDEERALPYGRLLCSNADVPLQNIEFKDATAAQRRIPLANGGMYSFTRRALEALLPCVSNANAAQEYYLPDVIALAVQKGFTTALIETAHGNLRGVNTRSDLANAHYLLQERWRAKAMENGVTLLDPASTFLAADTFLGPDTIVHPFVIFGPGAHLEGDSTVFAHSYLENCHIHSHVKIGPFAHIRGGTTLHSGSEIGNFVEVKKSTFHQGAKAKHLSYIGDAHIGAQTNIGAGTITANYDGTHKHATRIGSRVKVGANTALVAPVTVGDESVVGAGSVITEDVPPHSLALGRARQVVKPRTI